MAVSRLSSILPVKNHRGQTMVEYILLLSVLVSIGFAIFRSDMFQNFIGEDSAFFDAISGYTEYTYRHGTGEGRASENTDGITNHKSYYFGGKSRFFIATGEAYP